MFVFREGTGIAPESSRYPPRFPAEADVFRSGP
jgi:hypothetical protein